MPGTYKIIKKVPHEAKFACYVKFNEEIDEDFYSKEHYPEGGEYWEHESTDPSEIHAALESTAEADFNHWTGLGASEKALNGVKFDKKGQIVL